jgi:hypothetical protein
MLELLLIAFSVTGVTGDQIRNLPEFDPPPVRSASAPPAPDIPNHPHGILPPPEMDGSARLFLGATLPEVQAMMGVAQPQREAVGDTLLYHGTGCDIVIRFTGGKVFHVFAMKTVNSEPDDLMTCLQTVRRQGG